LHGLSAAPDKSPAISKRAHPVAGFVATLCIGKFFYVGAARRVARLAREVAWLKRPVLIAGPFVLTARESGVFRVAFRVLPDGGAPLTFLRWLAAVGNSIAALAPRSKLGHCRPLY
jgi:hypothetical protein